MAEVKVKQRPMAEVMGLLISLVILLVNFPAVLALLETALLVLVPVVKKWVLMAIQVF